jgi:hypothetical protein
MSNRQSYLSLVLFALALLFGALVVTVLITVPALGKAVTMSC